ncbi:hypothetical protein [Candidatus Hydrogenosomobacter endosymbioticus]|uniref:Uncharacterized protein n=1 Tax=Candidatus Hydrogenosomobacter endosymbioticus TaxID=2558174 RepID=A0ABM7V9N2_9PROT|nr:hypothetical protein [Candidatus Hydrogenosomobacter endosymbioticus]BDB96495.1 hypothetical protein HYD_6280 [Candidatus Hydrogenosomobacter endosymbioticus]
MKKLFLFLFALTAASSAFAGQDEFYSRINNLKSAINSNWQSSENDRIRLKIALEEMLSYEDTFGDTIEMSTMGIKRASEAIKKAQEILKNLENVNKKPQDQKNMISDFDKNPQMQ